MKTALLVVMLAACASAKDGGPAPRPAQEVVTGAGRVRGGGVRMDVSIGHAFGQRPTKASGKAIKQGVVTP